MSSVPSVRCPNCGVELPTGGLSPGVMVQCARCSTQFMLDTAGMQPPRTSGKAVASLVLGIIPGFFITGVPAVILGIWALLDIRSRPHQLRGSGVATSGIVLGGICSLLCTPLAVIAFFFTTEVMEKAEMTDDPAATAAIAERIMDVDMPEGIDPLFGMDTGPIGMRMAVYGDTEQNPATIIMMMRFPAFMAMDQKQMEQQMRQQMQGRQQMGLDIDGTRRVTYTIRGQPVSVTENVGKDPNTQQRARQYMAMIATENGPVMVMLMTQEPPAEPAGEQDAGQVRLSEQDVKEFFESIR